MGQFRHAPKHRTVCDPAGGPVEMRVSAAHDCPTGRTDWPGRAGYSGLESGSRATFRIRSLLQTRYAGQADPRLELTELTGTAGFVGGSIVRGDRWIHRTRLAWEEV